VSNDLISNGSWSEGKQGVYFEGTNILVKIDGSVPPQHVNNKNDDNSSNIEAGGVLFSAHYDSVSTAPGATDNGMGVVTLMQMIQYLTKNPPKRTAIFNINNGEEDWLNGAHA
jgi:Zn-dependent M28 family amino/carboxypeptidase